MVFKNIKIKVINPVQSGVSRIGNPWKKQEIVVEWNEEFTNANGVLTTRTPNLLCTLFGSQVDAFNQTGAVVGSFIEADIVFKISDGKFMNNEAHLFDVKLC